MKKYVQFFLGFLIREIAVDMQTHFLGQNKGGRAAEIGGSQIWSDKNQRRPLASQLASKIGRTTSRTSSQ